MLNRNIHKAKIYECQLYLCMLKSTEMWTVTFEYTYSNYVYYYVS